MFRSREYLAFVVRGRLCCAPGCYSLAEHAHHWGKRIGGGGTGCKPHDSFTVPLCSECHNDELHQKGHFPDRSAAETEVIFAVVSLQIVAEWLELKQDAKKTTKARSRACV